MIESAEVTPLIITRSALAKERVKRAQFNPHNHSRRKHGKVRRGPSATTTTVTSTSTSTTSTSTSSAYNPIATGPAVKTCSNGGGSDSCTTPYYTVSAGGVTLAPGYSKQPAPASSLYRAKLTISAAFPANGHVNFQVVDCSGWNGAGSYLSPQASWKTYSGGINFEIQGWGHPTFENAFCQLILSMPFSKPGYVYVGTNYFPFSGLTSGSLPTNGYCVTWVQVGQFVSCNRSRVCGTSELTVSSYRTNTLAKADSCRFAHHNAWRARLAA